MSKLDSIARDLDVARREYDALLNKGADHKIVEALGDRISVLQQQLRDAEDADGIVWDKDGHAGKWAHVADINL